MHMHTHTHRYNKRIFLLWESKFNFLRTALMIIYNPPNPVDMKAFIAVSLLRSNTVFHRFLAITVRWKCLQEMIEEWECVCGCVSVSVCVKALLKKTYPISEYDKRLILNTGKVKKKIRIDNKWWNSIGKNLFLRCIIKSNGFFSQPHVFFFFSF